MMRPIIAASAVAFMWTQAVLAAEGSGSTSAFERGRQLHDILDQAAFGASGAEAKMQEASDLYIEAMKAPSGALERIRRFPIQVGIHKSCEQCESFVATATEAEHGPSLQPGFA